MGLLDAFRSFVGRRAGSAVRVPQKVLDQDTFRPVDTPHLPVDTVDTPQANRAEEATGGLSRSTESRLLLEAYRSLSADAPLVGPAPDLHGPDVSTSDHSVFVGAVEIDFASAVRGIEGVRKVTREKGGLWCVHADRDVRTLIARAVIMGGGSLTLLAPRQIVIMPLLSEQAQRTPTSDV